MAIPKILLYYVFAPLADPDAVRLWQRDLCEGLGLRGRILISKDGLNGTLGGDLPALKRYVRKTRDYPAFRDIDFLDDIVAQYGSRIMIAVDVKDGMIATEGWTQTTSLPVVDAIQRLTSRGVRSFIYTDVSRDGKLTGPDLDAVKDVARAVRGRFIYSGGIGSLEHLRSLAQLRQVNMAGVIAGKSLYEKKFTVAEGQAALDGV